MIQQVLVYTPETPGVPSSWGLRSHAKRGAQAVHNESAHGLPKTSRGKPSRGQRGSARDREAAILHGWSGRPPSTLSFGQSPGR